MPDDGIDLELQKAVRATLAADPDLTQLIGTRLYQDVSEAAQFPYAVIGDTVINDDSTSCGDAAFIFLNVDVWSKAMGWEEAKRIAAAIRTCLHGASLSLASARCVEINHTVTRNVRDEPPLKQCIVTFSANVEDP